MLVELYDMDEVKLPLHVVKDGAKWLMLPTKVLLDMISSWPERQNRLTVAIRCFNIFSYLLFASGNLYYASQGRDLGAIAQAIIRLTAMAESTMRHVFGMHQGARLRNILRVVYHKFDSSDSSGPLIDKELRGDSLFVATFFGFCLSSGVISGIIYAIFTIVTMDVPLLTAFPFSWNDHPVYYGIMYCWQCYIGLDVVINICCTDLLFASLIYNCTAQFKLLSAHILGKFRSAPNKARFLARVVRKHNHLVEVCEELNSISSLFILLQCLITAGSICFSAFVVTTASESLASAVAFFMGHFSLLLLYCYSANELMIHSESLSDAIYFCGWHLGDTDVSVQRAIVPIMVRAQRSVKIWAGGFGHLSLTNFLKIIKFTFSVYTVLNAMLEKQTDDE